MYVPALARSSGAPEFLTLLICCVCPIGLRIRIVSISNVRTLVRAACSTHVGFRTQGRDSRRFLRSKGTVRHGVFPVLPAFLSSKTGFGKLQRSEALVDSDFFTACASCAVSELPVYIPSDS